MYVAVVQINTLRQRLTGARQRTFKVVSAEAPLPLSWGLVLCLPTSLQVMATNCGKILKDGIYNQKDIGYRLPRCLELSRIVVYRVCMLAKELTNRLTCPVYLSGTSYR